MIQKSGNRFSEKIMRQKMLGEQGATTKRVTL
jgi:hypothetical protein